MTRTALTTNREWNTRVVSTEKGEVAQNVIEEFNELWNSEYTFEYDDFFEIYKERYKIIKKQRQIARSEELPSIEKYRLQPNSMQVRFIVNLRKIIEAGEERALLISATGENGKIQTGTENAVNSTFTAVQKPVFFHASMAEPAAWCVVEPWKLNTGDQMIIDCRTNVRYNI